MEESSLQLNEIPILWTTCEKNKDRHKTMEKMLLDLDLTGTKITGPITDPYTIGVAIGYIDALSRFDPPFLILEDDATLVKNLTSLEINFPVGSDAFYLGTSIYGRIKQRTFPNGVIAADCGKYMRIFNMLGFHAVVYLTREYVEHVRRILESFIENPVGGCDDPIAEKMWTKNVYSVKSPIFYQRDGRSEQATTYPIDILL